MRHSIVLKSQGMQLVEAREGRELRGLLQELYHEKGLTQQQIADRFGVRRVTVGRWMNVLGIPSRWMSGEAA